MRLGPRRGVSPPPDAFITSDPTCIFAIWGGDGTMFQNTNGTSPCTANDQWVKLWKDRSLSGNHLSIPSATHPFLYKDNVINSVPGIRTIDLYTGTLFPFLFPANISMFLVFRTNSSGSFYPKVMPIRGPNGDVSKYVAVDYNGRASIFLPGGPPYKFSYGPLAEITPRGSAVILNWSRDNDFARGYTNGLEWPTPCTAPSAINIQWQLGSSTSGNDYFNDSFADGFCCCIIYNRVLSNAERNAVVQYLGAKYGISVV